MASGLLSTGPISRITELVVAKAGSCAEIVSLPQNRVNGLVDADTLDGEALRLSSQIAENPNLLAVPTPVMKITGNLYWPKDKPSPAGPNATVGIILGQSWPKAAAERLGVRPVEVKSYEQMLAMTRAGRLQGFIMAGEAFRHYLALDPDLASDNVRAIADIPLFLAVNLRHRALVPALDRQIAAMRADGTIDRLLQDSQ